MRPIETEAKEWESPLISETETERKCPIEVVTSVTHTQLHHHRQTHNGMIRKERERESERVNRKGVAVVLLVIKVSNANGAQ